MLLGSKLAMPQGVIISRRLTIGKRKIGSQVSDRCPLGYLLDHLSRRLIGELIGYSWSGVCRPFTMLKDLLQNRFANQSQILCGASLGRGNDILFTASGSHDQAGHRPIYGKNPSKIFISRTGGPIFTKLGM